MTKKTPSNNALKAYLAATKKETVLLGKIERHLLSRPPDTSRRQDVLHPSEITRSDWCIRKSWFVMRGHQAPSSNPNLRLSSIFSEGHAIHAKWQGWAADIDMLVGVWHCWEHGDWWGKRSDSCLFCEVKYKEVPVWHGDFDIAGHADGWLTSGHLLEIKSVGMGTLRMGGVPITGSLSESFRNLSRPLIGHIRQAMLYLYCLRWMHATGHLQEAPPDKLLFLYECKEDQNAREFVVSYDEEYLEPLFEKLALLDLDSETPPECTGGPKCDCKGLSL